MYKSAFQRLKRKFILVSGLLPAYFDLKKNQLKIIGFLNQIIVGKT